MFNDTTHTPVGLSAKAAPFSIDAPKDASAELVKEQKARQEIEEKLRIARVPADAADAAVLKAIAQEEAAKKTYEQARENTRLAKSVQSATDKNVFELQSQLADVNKNINQLRAAAGVSNMPTGVLRTTPGTPVARTTLADRVSAAADLPAPVPQPKKVVRQPVAIGCNYNDPQTKKLCGCPELAINNAGNLATFCQKHFDLCGKMRKAADERKSRK